MSLQYQDISYYNETVDKMKKRSEDFVIENTTYTRKIKSENKTIIFNEGATNDFRSLKYINKCRTDANNYIKGTNTFNNEEINFFKLFEKEEFQTGIVKVDVKSAYWRTAVIKGIISKQTDEDFHEDFKEEHPVILKRTRLKALGSLATRKLIIKYEKGKEKETSIFVQPTRDVYMNICKTVDDVMKQAAMELEGVIYYYWDCIFIKSKYESEAINFFRKLGYLSTCTPTQTRLTKIGNNFYLISLDDSKGYMVRVEDVYNII